MTTERLGFNELLVGQPDAYLRYNENLRKIEAFFGAAQSRVVATPPATPLDGQVWIVPAAATGVWAGKTNQLAHWYGGAWHFYVPCDRLRHWVLDADVAVQYKANLSAWV